MLNCLGVFSFIQPPHLAAYEYQLRATQGGQIYAGDEVLHSPSTPKRVKFAGGGSGNTRLGQLEPWGELLALAGAMIEGYVLQILRLVESLNFAL